MRQVFYRFNQFVGQSVSFGPERLQLIYSPNSWNDSAKSRYVRR
jgi:hypothetical protein